MTVVDNARDTLAQQHMIFDRRHYEKVIRELLAEIERLEKLAPPFCYTESYTTLPQKYPIQNVGSEK